MAFDKDQLVEHIIRPACDIFRKDDEAGIYLLLGTCAQESNFGTYIHQVGGPALGIFQIEDSTYYDIIDYLSLRQPDNYKAILRVCCYNYGPEPRKEALMYNLLFSACIARAKYWRVKEALPDANDVYGLAAYWKKYYNTELGKGTVEEFVVNYERYVC